MPRTMRGDPRTVGIIPHTAQVFDSLAPIAQCDEQVPHSGLPQRVPHEEQVVLRIIHQQYRFICLHQRKIFNTPRLGSTPEIPRSPAATEKIYHPAERQSRNQKQKRSNRGIRGKLYWAWAQQILSKLSDLDT